MLAGNVLGPEVLAGFMPTNEVGVHAHSCRIHPVPGRSFVVCFEANHSILICMYKCSSLNCRQPGCEWYVPNSLLTGLGFRVCSGPMAMLYALFNL